MTSADADPDIHQIYAISDVINSSTEDHKACHPVISDIIYETGTYATAGTQDLYDEITVKGRLFFTAVKIQMVNADLPSSYTTVVPSLPNDGMTTAEISKTWSNIKENNDIGARNMTVINLVKEPPGNTSGRHVVILANENWDGIANIEGTIVEEVSTQDQDFLNIGNIRIELGSELYGKWVNGGQQGTGISAIPAENSLEVTNLDTPFTIENIDIASDEILAYTIHFEIDENVSEVAEGFYEFRLSQKDNLGEVSGQVSYQVYTSESYSGAPISVIDKKKPSNQPERLKVYPNPFSSELSLETVFNENINGEIVVTNTTGQVIMRENLEFKKGNFTKTYDLNELKGGVYFITIIFEHYLETITMVKTTQ